MQVKARIAPSTVATASPIVVRSMPERVASAQLDVLFRLCEPIWWIWLICPVSLGLVLYELYDLTLIRFAIWLGLHIVNIIVRGVIMASYRKAAPEKRRRVPYGPMFTIATLLSGLTYGVGAITLLASNQREAEVIILLVLTATASGTTALLGAYLPAYFAENLPSLLPVMLQSALYADTFHITIFVMGICFVSTLAILARENNNKLRFTLLTDIEKIELINSLREKNEAVEQASRAKSRFLAAASHDLRQPVHALGMFVGALRERPLDTQSARLVDQVSGSVDAMDSLFASLLDISKLDAGVVRPNIVDFHVGPIIERICGDFAIEAEQKGLALTDCATSLAVRTDPVLLESLLRNLVSNAVRYTESGRILVGCRRGETIRIDVIDTGRGIAERDVEKIFEEFYQVGNAERDRSQGLGLGLAIVRRVATLLDCDLEINSRLGVGTRISIHVPLALGAPARATPDSFPWEDLALQLTVFVIDDEASIREGMTCLLESWGHRVFAADSGRSILTLASELPLRPDLVICDFRLRGGENGIDFMNRLRDEYNEQLPGMLITGDTAPDRLAEAGKSDYMIVHKPISSAKLRTAMRAAIARRNLLCEDARIPEWQS